MDRRHIIPIILFLLFSCTISAQENKLHFNIGIKAGVQAVTYNDAEFEIKGYSFARDNIQSNKIGYTVAPFLRLTKGRFYIQSEATFGITRHSFDFNDSEEIDSYTPTAHTPVYNLKTYCFQVPILLGYSFVKQGKFGISLFTGPRTKFTFISHSKQEFNNFKYENLYEELKKKTYYWEVGLGVNIHNVFFDFVYDIGLSDASEFISSGNEGETFPTKRRDNIQSFSAGVMF